MLDERISDTFFIDLVRVFDFDLDDMRFSLIRLAQGAKSAWKEKGPMAILDRPSNSALARKYNYGIRQETILDDLHGYGWWVVHKHFDEVWRSV